ncbi:aldo/keto reductase [Biformimicrobium ophioploci]|uniref:Aldo/keto reductase n=1 Tax=Biformimicrobium ophioploci TaxID=3036711 RepID=A0ABQ6M0K9_9GAMM|nr:aldo/keto reductase [Microbulbifer sp. NKW57]GMG87884.1 aldo/keto reductase [Microbulbifer sp. NKW57]
MDDFTGLPKRPLGNTGMQVSALGLGTVKLGRDQGVKYPGAFKIPDDRAASDLIALAQDLGINLIDTAPAYGNSEERLGKLLRGQRDQWLICSKVGEEFVGGESSFDFSAAHTRMSIERSLKRLNTDFLDIVLVHSNGDDSRIVQDEEVLATLAELKQQGLIGAIGMSSKTVEGGILAAQYSDAMMVTYNLREQGERAVLDYCRDNGVGVFIKKALASGHIAGEQGDTDPVQASMDFVFGHAGTSCAIIGTINPKHLENNCRKAARALSKN